MERIATIQAVEVSKPFEGLMPGVDSAVLSVLARTNRPRTGREIAKLAGRSHPAVQRVLDRLVEHGLVARQTAGRSYIYTVNPHHLAAPSIEALGNLRGELIQRLKAEITGWELPAEHASLFGSTARGDGTTKSDIDLLLVRPRNVPEEDHLWRNQLDHLADAVFRWTGNHAGVVEIGLNEINRLDRNRSPVVESLRNEAIDLAGSPAREVLSEVG